MLRQVGVQRLRGSLLSLALEGRGGAAKDVFTSLASIVIPVARHGTMERSFTASASEDEILTEERFATKIAILNRPRKLNALSPIMVARLRELYERWEKDPHVHLVILKIASFGKNRYVVRQIYLELAAQMHRSGNGRGFCAGGDVLGVCHMKKEGKIQEAVDYFKQEYILNYLIGTYKKPHIAFLDGVVMGGGTGISIHGRFRVATENTLFAMPETAIALHPDVGASYFLPRLPGHLGEYLALTGTRLDGADMMATNLATHFVPSHRLQMLEERLGGLNTEHTDVISNAVDEHCDIVQLKEKSPIHRRTEIDSCFGRSSMQEIIHAIEAGTKTGNPWYQETLNALKKASPLSLSITLRSVREGRKQSLHQCLERELRLSAHAVEGRFSNDFSEGCRAVLIDKDNLPKWDPPSLDQVTRELVEYHFSPIEGNLGEELHLPVGEREPPLKSAGYARL